jgi:putative tricarboxylic transport membrane protein
MTLDGYPLAQQGQAGKALTGAVLAGLVGGLIGTVVLATLVVPLAREALRFGPPEYFALAVFGVTVIGSLAHGQMLKGLAAGALGLLLTTVGQDPVNGVSRYTFGMPALLQGLPFIPALIGLFALSEAFSLISDRDRRLGQPVSAVRRSWPDRAEFRYWLRFMVVGAGVGLFVAVHPGGGATIASLIAYSVARQMSRNPERFGHGAIEGLITPEAADKATVGAALIPLLGLGIPGSATTAVLIGAFTLHGIEPGPLIFRSHADVVFALLASLFVANGFVFLLGYLGVPVFARVTLVPRKFLVAGVAALCFLGAYANGGNLVAVWTTLGFGLLGYVMKLGGFPVAPVVLGLVLGPLLEVNLRQSLIISGGSWLIFVERPIAVFLFLLSAASIAVPPLWERRRRSRQATIENPEVVL